jgi:hypothetical protein
LPSPGLSAHFNEPFHDMSFVAIGSAAKHIVDGAFHLVLGGIDSQYISQLLKNVFQG